MKFSKVIFAVAALCAVSTVTPSSYLDRAKAKAKGYYASAKDAYTKVGGVEGVQGYYDQAQGYYGKAQDMYGKYQNYRGTPSAAERALEEANMAEMNEEARRLGVGTE